MFYFALINIRQPIENDNSKSNWFKKKPLDLRICTVQTAILILNDAGWKIKFALLLGELKKNNARFPSKKSVKCSETQEIGMKKKI